METSGDPDGDGFIDYARKTDAGLLNQGWKDSHDSIFQADGTTGRRSDRAVRGAGLCLRGVEGRGATGCAARRQATRPTNGRSGRSGCASASSSPSGARISTPTRWRSTAAARPCRVRTSNPGHCLFAGIVTPERAKRVCDTLMADASFNGWGVRTVAAGERRYNPQSYHNGSIWPHDNALIAAGASRYGFTGRGDAGFSAPRSN